MIKPGLMYWFKVILICLAGLSFIIFITWLDQKDRNRYYKWKKKNYPPPKSKKKDTHTRENT